MTSDSSILIKAGTAERRPSDFGPARLNKGENDALAGPRTPGTPETRPFGRPALAFLVLALPALWVGWLVYGYGVDMPWGDEWDGTCLLLEKMQGGTLGLSDFFAFHNEHRIFFPRVLAFTLALLTRWNVRTELLMIWILACVCSLNLWRMAQVIGWRNSRTRYWFLLGTNVLLFSPLQWENLLWGFQIGFFLPLATMTACLWVAPALRRPFDFLATMILCLISTFSIASGFASWFLTAPLLLLWNGKTRARGEKTWWVAWVAVGMGSIGFYFQGFARPAGHPSVLASLRHPFLAIQFTLAYLGTPFSSGTALDASVVASVIGAGLVILLLGCLLYLWRWRRDRTLLAQALPWVSLAGWALVNAVLTMLGRTGFGVSAATQSRYVSFAIMLPIGLLFLGSLILRQWRERCGIGMETVRLDRGLVCLATVFSVLLVCGTIESLDSWRRFQHNCLSGKAGILLVNILDDSQVLARHVHQRDPALKARINFLDRLGYLRPPLLRSDRIRDIAFWAETEAMGEINEFGGNSGGECSASGWAILPQSHRIADGVLLTYDDAQGEPIIFALVEVTSKRPEVSQKLNDNAYLACGWTKSWKVGQIPENSRLIRAWSFDAENCRAFPIGAASLEPTNAAP